MNRMQNIQESLKNTEHSGKPKVNGPADQESEDNEQLVIGKENGKYFARSTVDDYKYRPKCYTDVSLIEWIRGSRKRKIRGKKSNKENDPPGDINMGKVESAAGQIIDKDGELDEGAWEDELNNSDNDVRRSTYRCFTKEHPLYKTHDIKYDPGNIHNIIPNFVGGALPRSDQGDREYYCMTMLTIFKPWRSASDLKSAEKNWDESFTEYKFSKGEQKIMNNFNLRYKCLDSRDNLHSKLKKKVNRAAMQNDSEDDTTDESSDEDFTQQNDKAFSERDPNRYIALCTVASNWVKNKYTMAKILSHIQWLKTMRSNCADTERLYPDICLGSSRWTNRVKEC